MNKNIFLLFLTCSIIFSSQKLLAAPGDTTIVRAHDKTHWNWYGNFDRWAEFPPAGVEYGKVVMHYTLGCPGSGCSEWDYTTHIKLRHRTGEFDTTIVLAPDFTVDGSTVDSICYSTDTTFTTLFDTAFGGSYAAANDGMLIRYFNDPVDPWLQTDSAWAWPADYYDYVYDPGGNVIDSNWVASDLCEWISYDSVPTPVPVIEDYELGRVITPYAGTYPLNWTNTWEFDVTDFAPLLHDSVEIRAHYGGWQNGFTVTVDFEFIEGTPPRDVIGIDRLWNGAFNYGNTADPIENHLPALTLDVPTDAAMSNMRITTTGHSFGGNENCAEFCHKYHDVLINGNTFVQDLWRYDCDLNPLYPQAGTWVYDRGGWCPGSEVRHYDFDGTPFLIPGGTMTVDYNMAAYTYTGGAGFHPNYDVAAYQFWLGYPNFEMDAEIYHIVSPTTHDMYARNNPICNSPEVVIRNRAGNILTSATITYGVEGGTMSTFDWTGSLKFLEMDTVTLPRPDWGVLAPSGNIFTANISNPNGVSDQYVWNDGMKSKFLAPPSMPNQIAMLLITNDAPWETTWTLKDDVGTVLYENPMFMAANTWNEDTFNLDKGCYEFQILDTGGDGLYFFANNDGSGLARWKDPLTNQVLIPFTKEFGGELTFNFTVDTYLAANENLKEGSLGIFPNPNSGRFFVDINLPSPENVNVAVFSSVGKLIYTENFGKLRAELLEVKLPEVAAGIYLAKVSAGKFSKTERVIVK